MPRLSKERLNELKRSRNYTSKKIADETGIPKSTIEKIFGGFNKNPTIDSMQKIAKVLDCSIDDFLEYDSEPSQPFYPDRSISKLVQELCDNTNLKKLMNAAKSLSDEDLELLTYIAVRFSKN